METVPGVASAVVLRIYLRDPDLLVRLHSLDVLVRLESGDGILGELDTIVVG